MKHFKHVLATTDLSPESFSAVQYAAHLAEGQGAKLTILHVVHSISLAYTDFVPPVDMSNIDQAIEEAAQEKLDQWVKRHVKRRAGVSIVLRGGVVDEAICDYAKECDASVIVIATHGRKGLTHVVLGSVAERVVRSAPCPVLVIKPPKPVVEVARGGRKPAARTAPKKKK
jgi:nucleotide-binding universal stress UspA family protein